MSRQRLGEGRTISRKIRLPEELDQEFAMWADRLGMSVSEVLRLLMERWIKSTKGVHTK